MRHKRVDPGWTTTALIIMLCASVLLVAAVVGGMGQDVRRMEQRIEALEVAP